MNPNVPQEVRIINAISEQLFNSWPVSIIMIDLEDCIWRLNQQVMNELHLNEYVIGRRITDLLEVVCDKKNVLEAVVSRKRRGMGGSEYQVFVAVDKRSFLLSV